MGAGPREAQEEKNGPGHTACKDNPPEPAQIRALEGCFPRGRAAVDDHPQSADAQSAAQIEKPREPYGSQVSEQKF